MLSSMAWSGIFFKPPLNAGLYQVNANDHYEYPLWCSCFNSAHNLQSTFYLPRLFSQSQLMLLFTAEKSLYNRPSPSPSSPSPSPELVGSNLWLAIVCHSQMHQVAIRLWFMDSSGGDCTGWGESMAGQRLLLFSATTEATSVTLIPIG